MSNDDSGSLNKLPPPGEFIIIHPPLPPLFDYIETQELADIRTKAVDILFEAGPDQITPEVRKIMTEYQLKAEQVISLLTGEPYRRALLGLVVAKSEIYREAGWRDAVEQELDDAWIIAANQGWEEELENLIAILIGSEE